MVRILVSIAVWLGLVTLLKFIWNNSAQFEGAALVILAFVALFVLIWTWVTFRTINFHFARQAALRTEPVAVQINVTASGRRRGPSTLVAEVTVGEDLWLATLGGFANDREFAGKSWPGVAWLHHRTGAPLAFEISGKPLSPVPEVIKVRPDSMIEKLVQSQRHQ